MMGTSEQQTKAATALGAAQFIKTTADTNGQKFLGQLEIKPHDTPRISLGHYTPAMHLKGFAVQLSPEPESKDSIITRIASIGSADNYELVLQVANNGNSPLTAQVWEL